MGRCRYVPLRRRWVFHDVLMPNGMETVKPFSITNLLCKYGYMLKKELTVGIFDI